MPSLATTVLLAQQRSKKQARNASRVAPSTGRAFHAKATHSAIAAMTRIGTSAARASRSNARQSAATTSDQSVSPLSPFSLVPLPVPVPMLVVLVVADEDSGDSDSSHSARRCV